VVTGARVRDMLGLADKSARRELYTTMLSGDAKALLKAVDDQYSLGVEPLALIHSLMELTHAITVAQVSGGEPDAPTEDERTALKDLAGRLEPGQLHRLWQLLLKGHEEVRQAPDQLISAQMALLRVMHAADLPDPFTPWLMAWRKTPLRKFARRFSSTLASVGLLSAAKQRVRPLCVNNARRRRLTSPLSLSDTP